MPALHSSHEGWPCFQSRQHVVVVMSNASSCFESARLNELASWFAQGFMDDFSPAEITESFSARCAMSQQDHWLVRAWCRTGLDLAPPTS